MFEFEFNIADNIYSFFTREKKDHTALLSKEHSLINTYSQKRIVDFATGRYCARQALGKLGITSCEILLGKYREPIWPIGIVGSISHSDSLTGAIVAKNKDFHSIGIDIETIGFVKRDLWDILFTNNEKKILSSLSDNEADIYSSVLFSMKECFYKMQFPLSKTLLDFTCVEITKNNQCFELNVVANLPTKYIIPKPTNLFFRKTVNNEIVSFSYMQI